MAKLGQAPQEFNFHPAAHPLEGTLALRADIADFASQADIDNALSFLRHDGTFSGEPLHAAGRNVTMPLSGMLYAPYDAVQISGGAYIPMGVNSNSQARGGMVVRESTEPKDIYPPAQAPQRYTHTYSVVQGGVLKSRTDSSPMGSYTQKLADRKIAKTALAGKIASGNLVVPRVLGKYEYKELPDGMGGNATAILFAVPLGGLRADQAYVVPLMGAIQQRPDLLDTALDIYMPPIMKTLGMIGIVAADIHKAGIVHNQLTLGNVLPMQTESDGSRNLLYAADWETADNITEADKELLKALDLVVAFRSFSGGMERILSGSTNDQSRINPILLEGLMILVTSYAGINTGNLRALIDYDRKIWLDSLDAMLELSVDVDVFSPVLALIKKLITIQSTT